MQPYSFILSFFLIIGTTVSCGYQLAGTASTLPSHITTIAIPLFENGSGEPGIEKQVTQMIKKEFLHDGRLSVVDGQKADMIVHGRISAYSLKPVAFDEQDNATEYWVVMTVHIETLDTIKDKKIVQQDIQAKWDYRVQNSSVITAESARATAISEASRDLAQKVVSIIIEGF